MSKKLYRSEKNKVIAGVCAGIAEYFDWDPTLVRIGFVLVTVAGFGSAVVLYIILWLLVPTQSSGFEMTEEMLKQNVEDIKDTVEKTAEKVKKKIKR